VIFFVVAVFTGLQLLTVRVIIRSHRALEHRIIILENEVSRLKPVATWHANRIIKEGRE